jgi:hypothetical protein
MTRSPRADKSSPLPRSSCWLPHNSDQRRLTSDIEARSRCSARAQNFEEGRRGHPKVPSIDDGIAYYAQVLGHQLAWKNHEIAQSGLSMPDAHPEIVLTTHHSSEPN